MGQTKGREQGKVEFVKSAERMYDELEEWRGQHLGASVDEIAAQVRVRRRELMGRLIAELAEKADERVIAPVCEGCGEAMEYKGTPERWVGHGEGEVRLERAYWYCDRCESGLFPPGRQSATG